MTDYLLHLTEYFGYLTEILRHLTELFLRLTELFRCLTELFEHLTEFLSWTRLVWQNCFCVWQNNFSIWQNSCQELGLFDRKSQKCLKIRKAYWSRTLINILKNPRDKSCKTIFRNFCQEDFSKYWFMSEINRLFWFLNIFGMFCQTNLALDRISVKRQKCSVKHDCRLWQNSTLSM